MAFIRQKDLSVPADIDRLLVMHPLQVPYHIAVIHLNLQHLFTGAVVKKIHLTQKQELPLSVNCRTLPVVIIKQKEHVFAAFLQPFIPARSSGCRDPGKLSAIYDRLVISIHGQLCIIHSQTALKQCVLHKSLSAHYIIQYRSKLHVQKIFYVTVQINILSRGRRMLHGIGQVILHGARHIFHFILLSLPLQTDQVI